ncbi:hypothetical protein SGCOL_008076 [Colletotrichum sp. CLE4]
MDLFQRLDEDITNIIIEHGFLNLDTIRFATEREVERAAVRALEMAAPDQQLAIAMRQSAMAVEGNHNINDNDANHDANNANNGNNDNTGGYIGWEERNRLLTDTRTNSAETSDAEDDNNDNDTCVVCFTTRQPHHRLPCGCRMCPRCLRRCLRAGLRAGGWPPRCCQPLRQDNVEQAAGTERPGLVRLYRQIRVEEETPGEERKFPSRKCKISNPWERYRLQISATYTTWMKKLISDRVGDGSVSSCTTQTAETPRTSPSVKSSQKPENGAPSAAPPDAALLPSRAQARGGDQEYRGPGPYSRSTPRTRCATTTCRRRGRWRT